MIALDSPSWQVIAAEKRQEIYAAIPVTYIVDETLLNGTDPIDLPRRTGILTEREMSITESRAVDIVQRIKAREYTAFEVTTAFCKRAAIAHQAVSKTYTRMASDVLTRVETNCLAAVLFDNALEQAKELDQYMERHGKPRGPLHGLPISVKEHVYLEGTLATSGLIAWKDAMSPEDALIVQIFREAGAVFHVKTTNPQTLMVMISISSCYT